MAEDKKTNGDGIDPKYLKDLVFRTSKEKVVEEDGIKKKRFIPVERDLTPDDVMSWKDCGTSVVIATNDGKKYTVKKGK